MNRLADFVVNNRIKVAIITLLMALTVFSGIPNLRLDTDGRVFMANDNPDKILLDKLQNTRSNYDNNKWQREFQDKLQLKNMIRKNGDRFCRNPYFLNSICTNNAGLNGLGAVTTNRSLHHPQA